MKTQLECIETLLTGVKMHYDDSDSDYMRPGGEYIYFKGHGVFNAFDNPTGVPSFLEPEKWSIYREHFDIKKAVELFKGNIIKSEHWHKDDSLGKSSGMFFRYNPNRDHTYAFTEEDILVEDYYIVEEGME